MLPVSEAEAIMIRSATEVQYDAEDDEPGDCDDFDRSEYELCFAIGT